MADSGGCGAQQTAKYKGIFQGTVSVRRIRHNCSRRRRFCGQLAAARQIHNGETAGMAAAGLATAVLWLCAPLIAEKKDEKPDSYRFTAAERGRLTELFADTWQYFEQNCTEKTSWLPPDNFQEEPYRGAAMLTSPTNIGMGLMAVVSAHDMHLLDERGMFTRLERMVNSIEKLEKWHGHPFNWYNPARLIAAASALHIDC